MLCRKFGGCKDAAVHAEQDRGGSRSPSVHSGFCPGQLIPQPRHAIYWLQDDAAFTGFYYTAELEGPWQTLLQASQAQPGSESVTIPLVSVLFLQ